MKQANVLTACTDSNNGKTDALGNDCSEYQSYPWSCGNVNDDDFDSNEMCCACKGDV